jgi:hypothetical protein
MENGSDNIKLPPAFSGPAQLVLYTRYDDPRAPGWEHKWLMNWHVQQRHPWFPEEEIRIHKHFWPMLDEAFAELEQHGLHSEIKTFHGGHKLGHIHNSPVLSVHSWGAAIDLNADDNPIGTMGKWSEAFINTMTKHGIYCGQNWTGSKEPMHFSMVNGD